VDQYSVPSVYPICILLPETITRPGTYPEIHKRRQARKLAAQATDSKARNTSTAGKIGIRKVI